MKIALIINTEKNKALICANEIIDLLADCGAEVLMLSDMLSFFEDKKAEYIDSYEELFSLCDLAVTVGGDGTIIHTARYAAKASKPVLGVNLGRLGYVAELEPTEISMLRSLVSGDYSTVKRMLLEVTVKSENGDSLTYLAVNDAVVSGGVLSRMLELEVYADDEFISTYRADGLLLSTPTGSTAYALSAGGPVISPALSLIELTPVCSHSLTARTVLFTDDTVLSVRCKDSDTAYLTIDGQISIPLESTDKVQVSRSEYSLSTITLKDKNFYKTAGEKLKGEN